MLTKITVENFKAFGEETIINIAPITLLFGKNSSGKSTILHAVGLVDDVIRNSLQPKSADEQRNRLLKTSESIASESNISDRAWDGISYCELVHGQDISRRIRIRLDFQDEQGEMGIEMECLGLENTKCDSPYQQGSLPSWPFDLKFYELGEATPKITLNYRGDSVGLNIPAEYGRRLKAELDLFSHAPSHRPMSEIKVIGPSGSKGPVASKLLRELRASLAEDPHALQKLNEALKQIDGRYEVDGMLNVRGGGVNSRLMPLQSVGSGIGQILPILHLCTASQKRNLFFQQPEEELHPAAQYEMADVLIASAEKSGNRLLIETHSEHLLLRILRRIRNGELTFKEYNEKVRIYFIEAGHSTPLTVESDGSFRIDQLPRGFFEERYAELGIPI